MFSNRVSKILFYVFVLFLPWQTRIILFPEKPEFLSFSIYLSEIFLWLALAFWLANTDLKKIKIPFVFLFFCFFVLSSIAWAPDKIAAFRLWLCIFDGIMIYLYAQEHGEIFKTAPICFLISLFFSACLGIWQFFTLGSPAWKWLGLAERGAWNLGDIVVESGGRFLRAYGSFPHPNILGGYLAAGILLLITSFSFLKNNNENSPLRRRGVGGDLFIYFLSGIFFLALFLTFSRSAWIGLSIVLLYLFFNFYKNRYIITHTIVVVMIHRFFQYFIFLVSLAIIFSIIFWPFLKTRAGSEGRLEAKSNTERVESWKEGLAVWKDNLFFGIGAGNNTFFVIPDPERERGNYSGIQIDGWIPGQTRNDNNIQPSHNIFILILSELGIIGFLIYLSIWKNFWQNPAAFTPTPKGLVWGRPFLILFFIIGLFDHYLWTLYSGQMLFWLGVGMIYSKY